MTDRKLMQQALESIDWLRHHLIQHHGCLHMDPTASGIPAWLNKNEAALRAALAEPVQKSKYIQHGWLCPSCGAGNSPMNMRCGCKGWPKMEITC